MNNDEYLPWMKQAIDESIKEDEKIQQFLVWLHQKTKSLGSPYQGAALRAIFMAFILDIENNPVNHLFTKIDQSLNFEYQSLYDLLYGFFSRPNNSTYDFAVLLIINKLENGKFNTHFKKIELPNRDWEPDDKLGFDTYKYLCFVLEDNQYINGDILNLLPSFEYYLPKDASGAEQSLRWGYLDDWWTVNNDDWSKQIQIILNNYRNLGNSWQPNDKQKEILKNSYDANKLLMDCLNSSTSVSDEIRRDIEDPLLLPIAEIEKRKREKAK
ncbi:NACHT C-terminal helical domain 2-containing protein [Microseira wollei]|uniref:Signal transduction protein containing Nacht domain n=1 Tax=Microseira wollei NIES-4236 TaxID=2530354 RepID=A0AAV3XRN1_9CYAN|nr:hypothetical protein [Microseira wollei]GET44341.1 putative signal transduction protein containing Nacht domain [Microseira wollei NIES-4236]